MLSLLPLDPVLSSLQGSIPVLNIDLATGIFKAFATIICLYFWDPSYNPGFDNNPQGIPCW